jgi:hypothetical protein
MDFSPPMPVIHVVRFSIMIVWNGFLDMLFSTRLLFARKDMEGHQYLALSNKGTLFNVLRLLHLIAQAHYSTWSLHCSRIFFSASFSDKFSILGALPLFAYSTISKKNPFGLESFVTMNCSRITNYGYLTSSCIHYIRWLHDVSANKELSNSDSRHVSELGFVVDTKSSTGLSVRNKGESALSNSVDSHQMVRSLCASQEYIKFDMFLTFTCSQKDFPGTFNLFHWKSSKELWASSIPDYHSMSEIEHKEFSDSIEELYSVIAFRNWMEGRQLWLDFIFNDVACHGACACLFSRSEYQKDSGNFPHEHTILALKKDTLNS